ncbi:hypothetical protein PflCFBP13510_23035 [Pseudomonas fluorescens]|nr:hypothetical protein PflCFBP13510_23035 [Pseudomonas fluorescens]
MAACQPPPIYLTPHDPTVGAGLPAMTPSQPTNIYLTPQRSNCVDCQAAFASKPAPTVGWCMGLMSNQ